MIKFAGESEKSAFILGTEIGLLYPISKAHPEKKFFAASEKMFCRDMKKITLEKIAHSLEHLKGEVKVPEEIRKKAFGAVQKMILL
jgi:quinolinate synthase